MHVYCKHVVGFDLRLEAIFTDIILALCLLEVSPET